MASPLATILGSSLVFTLWHLAVNFLTLEQTSFADSVATSAVVFLFVSMAAFTAGVVLGALREVTGHLAPSMAGHWVINSAMMTALFLKGGTVG